MAKIVTSLALVPGAGATFIATNIGAWTANKGIKTLLIDRSARGVLGPLFIVEKAKEKVYPTTATWQEFSDPASSLIKTQYGLAVLPAPERDKNTDYDLNVETILDYFDPLFEVIVIDLGGDIYLPHVFPIMEKASKNILVAEPSKRCVEALPGHIKEILMQYKPELIINRVTSRAYYHPRDIARQFNVGQYIAIIDDPKFNNEAIKQRLPLSLYGKGKTAKNLVELAKYILSDTLTQEKGKEVSNNYSNGYNPKNLFVNRLPQIRLPSFGCSIKKAEIIPKPVQEKTDVSSSKNPLHLYALGEFKTDIAGVSCFASIDELEKAINIKDPTCIILPAAPGVTGNLKNLRRRVKLASIPVAVIGRCNDCDNIAAIYEAGADEQADELTPEVIKKLVARKKRLEALWSRAVRDDLTGLYKRGFMEECLQEALESYQNNNVPVAFLICDLDHFKQVNDTYGHQAGDSVLREFARFLRLSVRETDIVARYGGEEFAVIFPRTEGEIARTVAQRLCEAWAEHVIDIGGRKVSSTFSAGLAASAQGMAPPDMIKAADQALYRAKKAGRNRVVAAWDKIVPAFSPVPPVGVQSIPAVRPGAVVKNAAPVKMPVRIETTRLSALTTPSPVQEVPPPVPQSLPKLQPPPPARRTGGFSFVPMENMVVLYGVTPGADVAGAAIEICRSLQKARFKVALIEANFSNPGLALRLGIPGEEMWDRDWRIGGASVGGYWQGIAAWLLDPWVKDTPPEEDLLSILRDMLNAAVELKSKWIIVECDYDFPYFKALSRAAGHTLAVIRPGERLPLYGDFPGILVKDRAGSTEYPAYEIHQIADMLKNKKEMTAN